MTDLRTNPATEPSSVPDPPVAPPTRSVRLPRWLRHPSRRALVGVGVVVVAGVLLATRVVGGASSAGYRTVEASEQDVDQVLEGVATVEPVEQAAVSFPVAGTVATVDVAVGDRVETGDVLATLDDTDLQRSLVEAQASLADAELTLEKALNGEAVAPSGGTDGGVGGTALATSSSSGGTVELGDVELVAYSTPATGAATESATATSASSVTDADVAAAQQAVLAAQQQVDADTAAAQAALDNAAAVCATVDPGTGTVDAASCQAALDSALVAQQALAASQAALSQAMDAYDALLDQRAAEAPATTTTTTLSSDGGATSGLPDAGSSGGASAGSAPSGGTSTSSSPTAAELVAYQRDVDKAALGVLVAQQAVRQATIVAPVGGRVVAVDLAVGDEVDAESDTAAVVVRGTGGYEVTTFVAVDDLEDLELGQAAEVLPDGADGALDGEVVQIGVVATDGSYPVTIGLAGDGQGADLGNGATATVGIVTAAADHVLAVPTSAVAVSGDRHTVTVLDGGAPTEVEVQVGAVGDPWTEITDGLTDGQQVVLADLDEPLPSSATATSSSTGGGPTFGGGPPGFGG